jgi:hypothetical protein
LILFTAMTRRRLGLLGLRQLVASSVPVLVGNIPLAGVIAVYLILLRPAFAGTPFLTRLVLLAGTTVTGFAITIGMYLLLKIDIVKDILKERFGKKGGSEKT